VFLETIHPEPSV